MEDYKKILKSEEYTFLHTNEHLGRHIILLGPDIHPFQAVQ